MANFNVWKTTRIGKHLDIDKMYSAQCVDVIMDYVQYLWNKPWPQIIGYGNAKDLFRTSSASYFTKIVNNPNDLNQLPKQGDVIVYNGTKTNPYGHIAVVVSADRNGVTVVEQDGFNPGGAAYQKTRPFKGGAPIIGWLRPKVSLVSTVVQAVKPKPPVPAPTYIVRPGDTLGRIASMFNTTVAKLAALNGIKNVDVIKIGQVLKVR